MGLDANLDLRNYHYYNAYAFLTDRQALDVAPGQRQTFMNPLLDLPFYWMAQAWPPVWVGGCGAWGGARAESHAPRIALQPGHPVAGRAITLGRRAAAAVAEPSRARVSRRTGHHDERQPRQPVRAPAAAAAGTGGGRRAAPTGEEGIEWLRGVVRDKESTVAELEKEVEWLRKEIRERDRVIEALRADAGPARNRTEP
jgi:hypothetical protein